MVSNEDGEMAENVLQQLQALDTPTITAVVRKDMRDPELRSRTGPLNRSDMRRSLIPPAGCIVSLANAPVSGASKIGR